MSLRSPCAAALLVLGSSVPSLAFAQSAGSGITMPYERGFWGHAGVSIGGARLDATCPPGSGCDDSEQAFRIYGGGKFNNIFGGEIGWLKLGDFSRGGGETDAKAFDFALLAGVPFGNNWSAFAKLGAAYTRTHVTGTAAGLQTGSANGWGPRVGVGLQIGITDNWAARLDWDRYRFKMPGGRENIDTLMIGAQYTFR
ncbi:MAG: porin family protein [Betaproteobacteria bacterium]|nr:MAG: porin family protein [Betaproteobacteria bacterium]